MRVIPDQNNHADGRTPLPPSPPASSSRWTRAWQAMVGLGFHLLYHQLAWTYDTVSWLVSLGQWRAWQTTVLEEVRGAAVLELGHGPGHMLARLAAAGYRVSGIDPSPQMGALAARRLRRAGLTTCLVRSTAQQLPFASGQFDTVFATFPTSYILDPCTLAAVQRVLAANGRFLIVPEARLTGNGPIVRALEFLYRLTGQRPPADEASDPAWTTSRRAFYASRLAAAGFSSSFQEVHLDRSVVLLILAQKQHGARQSGEPDEAPVPRKQDFSSDPGPRPEAFA